MKKYEREVYSLPEDSERTEQFSFLKGNFCRLVFMRKKVLRNKVEEAY